MPPPKDKKSEVPAEVPAEVSSEVPDIKPEDSVSNIGLSVTSQSTVLPKPTSKEDDLKAKLNESEQLLRMESEQLRLEMDRRQVELEFKQRERDLALRVSHLKSEPEVGAQSVVVVDECYRSDVSAGSSRAMRAVYQPPMDDVGRSIVNELRKPQVEVEKFSGDPLEFKRFKRQFDARVVAYTSNDEERVSYLEQLTTGEPLRIVKGYSSLSGSVAYKAIFQEFDERYGDNSTIASAYIKKALEWPSQKLSQPKLLDEFGMFLLECLNAVTSMDAVAVLEYPDNLRVLLSKLPFHYHDRWRTLVLKLKDANKSVRFADFVSFVRQEAKKLNDPIFGKAAVADSAGKRQPPLSDGRHKSCATVGAAAASTCLFCNKNHDLKLCRSLASKPLQERLTFLRHKNMCFGCLRHGHHSKECRNKLMCDTCGKYHPTVLHENRSAKPTPENQHAGASTSTGNVATNTTPAPPVVENTVVKSVGAASVIGSHDALGCYMGAGEGECTMAIIPVKVKSHRNITVECYAFLDPGSNVSFCTDELASILQVSGAKLPMMIGTMCGSQRCDVRRVHGLEVSSLDGARFVKLPALYTRDGMPVSERHIPTEDDVAHWEHLKDIRVPRIDGKVMLLIGNNVPEAYAPYESCIGPSGSPYASRSSLGWILWGVIREQVAESSDDTLSVHVNHVEAKALQDADRLEELLRKSMNFDFPEKTIDTRREPSREDLLFSKKVNDSIQLIDGHYSISLPFRDSTLMLPDNQSQALQRLKYLQKKLEVDDKLHSEYTAFMHKVIEAGHAEKVPASQVTRSDGKVWYIPHHGVYHPRKHKLRVVFDCAARFKGVSINDMLLSGPNMTNDLMEVLLRFRQEPFAVSGDIEAMFYQVVVPPDDRDCLRFFWWPDGDLTSQPQVYRMTVHLFGAVSSPACANFALRQTAIDHGYKFSSSVSETISRNFYVDDCLRAVNSVSDGFSMVRELTSLCRLGGFHLTKWSSNDTNIIASIPVEERSKELQNYQLDKDHDIPTERALGVEWRPQTDAFGFTLNLPEKPATRRGLLSTIHSVYDPLGLASPLVFPAKRILQSLVKQGIDWDEPIPAAELKQWNNWLGTIPGIESIEIPRSLKPVDFSVENYQLHLFSDASESGYGVAAYTRLQNHDSLVYCNLVLGKARVAPCKKVTIPRLELTAATLAVKIADMITEAVDYKFDGVYFWTDSTSVLRYIQNTTTRFHTFVANRLTVIHEGSSPSQWRYVVSKENPADMASRGISFKDDAIDRWIYGPAFLWKPESEWPEKFPSSELSMNDPEVKKVTACATSLCTPSDEVIATMDLLLNKFSSWEKLKKSVAWLLRVKKILKGRATKLTDSESFADRPRLTVQELEAAELAIVKYLQSRYLADEVFKRNSPLRKLDAFIDNEGLLRVGGRLSRADVAYGIKHPVILPGDSQVTYRIIEATHKQLGHSGRNAVLARIREKYWLTKASRVIRSVLSRCVVCRKYKGKTGSQKMADLPVQRVIGGERPFTRTGIDFFGPFSTKVKRSMVKRYGMLFTCFQSRAIHLELADSLDVNSCINGIRRFVARRGPVKWIRSDNGTNLVGANKELRESIQAWNTDLMYTKLQQLGIQWEFNTPTASHHGGIWERLIRSVRKVLYGLMNEQTVHLNDDGLHTLLCEVELIVNSRPITALTDDSRDPEALTPNHLLMFQPDAQLPPGVFSRDDTYARRRWRHIQYLSDIFWKRWRSEYLVALQERQKWQRPSRNMQVGDIVLIADNCPRNQWLMGRITEVKSDKNGFVRIAVVKTATSTFERPITKLCTLLEVDT